MSKLVIVSNCCVRLLTTEFPQLTFDCEEHAIEFAKRNGWKYEVSQPVTLDDVAESQGEEYRYKHNFLDPRVGTFNQLQMFARQSNDYLSDCGAARPRRTKDEDIREPWFRQEQLLHAA